MHLGCYMDIVSICERLDNEEPRGDLTLMA
jgi:hypothetical protein